MEPQLDPDQIRHGSDIRTTTKASRETNRNRTLPDEEIRNRFGYHAGNTVTMPKHADVRARFIEMCTFLDEILPAGRAKSVAFTELESAAMWANKAIAEMAPVVQQ